MNRIAKIIIVLSIMFSQVAFAAQTIDITPVKFNEVDSGMPYNVKKVPVADAQSMAGARIAIVAAHGFEEIEATYPIDFFLSRGAEVDIISPDWIKDRVMAVQFLKPSVWLPVTKNISQAVVDDYCAIVIPGGAWNPIIMRTDQQILEFVKSAHKANKLVAAVCHGPQVLISAGLANGRMMTGVGDIRIDLSNAGAEVIHDQPVVLDGNILTSRDPKDLAEFSKGIEEYIRQNLAFGQLHEATGNARSQAVVCPVCKGTGRLHGGPGMYPYTCYECNGKGHVHSNKPPVSTDH